MEEKEPIATVEPNTVWVTNHKAGKAFDDQRKKGGDTDLNELVCGRLEPNKKGQLMGLLTRFKDVFYKGVEHTIRLKEDSTPVACKPRRLSSELAEEVRSMLMNF